MISGLFWAVVATYSVLTCFRGRHLGYHTHSDAVTHGPTGPMAQGPLKILDLGGP